MPRGRPPVPLAERFATHYEPVTESGCWLWTGRVENTGYAQIRLDDQTRTGAHRASWLIHFGAIPPGLEVCHKCDVRSCVNPAHLFLGTSLDNQRDKVAKGRQAYGERNGQARLDADKVRYIRESPDVTHGKLAVELGVSAGTIWKVRNGYSWTHV